MPKIVGLGCADGLQRARPGIEAALGVVIALGISMGCSVDTTGLATTPDAGAVTVGDAAGSGSGGKPSDAAFSGSGGKAGSGGAPGDGGKTGSGGIAASGGATATGGVADSGGSNVPGSGGVSDRAGAVGSGGPSSSGGSGGSGGTVASIGGAAGQAAGGRAGSSSAGGGGAGAGGSGTGGASCGPTSCADGCCMEGTCVRGHTNDRCGMGGVACGACTHCFKCSSQGRCDLDPGSTWNVVCGSATIQSTSANGTVWDPQFGMGGVGSGDFTGTPPDPVCQFLSGTTLQKQTAIQVDTLTPTWNTVISPGNSSVKTLMSTASRWSVRIVDDDGGGAFSLPEEICQVTPSPTAEDFSAGQLSFDSVGRCVHLSLQLVCAM